MLLQGPATVSHATWRDCPGYKHHNGADACGNRSVRLAFSATPPTDEGFVIWIQTNLHGVAVVRFGLADESESALDCLNGFPCTRCYGGSTLQNTVHAVAANQCTQPCARDHGPLVCTMTAVPAICTHHGIVQPCPCGRTARSARMHSFNNPHGATTFTPEHRAICMPVPIPSNCRRPAPVLVRGHVPS
jgi:hypothetical protein